MSGQQWWWLGLLLFGVVVAVVAILLGAILATARRIEAHAAGIWTVGKEIAGNTVSIWALPQANQTLERVIAEIRKLGGRVKG
jgi:hypothetical protein